MATKQLWCWQGIDSDGHAQEGVLWAQNRAGLLLNL